MTNEKKNRKIRRRKKNGQFGKNNKNWKKQEIFEKKKIGNIQEILRKLGNLRKNCDTLIKRGRVEIIL